ncbi:MAG: hypothetical protein SWH78_07075 [Thermodesulfobacteriota bacterium]|nr:hypothetical protein [Thermodesulfobacteriota bacterium]
MDGHVGAHPLASKGMERGRQCTDEYFLLISKAAPGIASEDI